MTFHEKMSDKPKSGELRQKRLAFLGNGVHRLPDWNIDKCMNASIDEFVHKLIDSSIGERTNLRKSE